MRFSNEIRGRGFVLGDLYLSVHSWYLNVASLILKAFTGVSTSAMASLRMENSMGFFVLVG